MRTVLLLVALPLAASAALAQTYSTERGTVSFTSRVPLHTFTGTSDHLTGFVNLGSREVDFHVDLETLETGIGKRDRDMRDALETDRYPFAEFTGRLTTTLDPESTARQQARVQGTFTIHGVARSRTIVGTLQKVRGGYRLRASFQVRLDDHRIEPPRLLMIKVNQVQEVEIDALLRS